jgi:hypothetical protein
MTRAERERLWLRRLHYEWDWEVDHPRRHGRIMFYLERLAKVWGLRWD